MNQAEIFEPSETLAEARERLEDGKHSRDGMICPCCDQRAKVYRRKFSAAMCRGLIWLYHEGGAHRFVHVNEKAPRWLIGFGGYFALAEKWGLIEDVENTDERKRRSGMWRLTPIGVAFVECRVRIATHVEVYNNEAIGWSDEHATIEQLLADRFSYAEIMRYDAAGRPAGDE